MKPSTLSFLLLLASPTTSTYTPEALDYVLRSIEYEASVAGGTFSLIVYDLAPKYPFDNILNAILHSPRLEHVVKYVINGPYHKALENLPWHPSMLLIHPGNDARHLKRPKTSKDLDTVLELFNPTAKVLIFVDFNNSNVLGTIFQEVFYVGFASTVFFDAVSMRADLWNSIKSVVWVRVPPLMYLYTWLRRSMTGVNITYYSPEPVSDLHYNVFWINEVARFLNTEASQYLTHCGKLYGLSLEKCLAKQRAQLMSIDIRFHLTEMRPYPPRKFISLATGAPLIMKVAVPRDRPLNVAELMVMPFSWEVWVLLSVVLVLAEVMKYLFPNMFKNEPTLLIVCGFERHNLHDAGNLEKIVCLSLIILMFFTSNAFETKLLSMMVSKPSIQRIKTLDDLLSSDIKFYNDLEGSPYLVNHTVFGKMLVQGTPNYFDTIPGVGFLADQEKAELLELTAFDYERMQPWYVLLDFEYHLNYELHVMSWRNQQLEIFRYVYGKLFEAGLIDYWKRLYKDQVRVVCIGRRQRVHIECKVDLNFDDMQPAWVILAIGLGGSFVAFFGELSSKWCKKKEQ